MLAHWAKFIAVVTTTLLMLVSSGQAQEIARAEDQTWTTYTNVRFSFLVDVPSIGFEALPAPDNGDGQRWQSADGLIEITTYGAHWSSTSRSFADYRALLFGFLLADGAEITQKAEEDRWFTYSGVQRDSRIFQTKAVALPNCDVAAHVLAVYPEELGDVMGDIFVRISESLGPSVAIC